MQRKQRSEECTHEYNSQLGGVEGCEWGCREIGDVYQWSLGLAEAQTFYFASACQSRDSLLSSPGITL